MRAKRASPLERENDSLAPNNHHPFPQEWGIKGVDSQYTLLDVYWLTDRIQAKLSKSVGSASPPPSRGGFFGAKVKLLTLIFVLALSGCASGRMICEWETQDERFEKLIEGVLQHEKATNVPLEVEEAVP